MDAASLFGGPTSSPHRTTRLATAFTTSDDNEPPSAASLFGGAPEDVTFALPPSSTFQLRRSEPPQVQEMPDDLFGGEGNGGGEGGSFYGASSTRQNAPFAPSRSDFGGAPRPPSRVVPPPPPVETMPVGLFGSGSEDGNSPAAAFGFGGSKCQFGDGGSDNIRGVVPAPPNGFSGNGLSRTPGTSIYGGTYSGRPHPTAGFGGDSERKSGSPPPSGATEACDAPPRDFSGSQASDSLGSTVCGTKRTGQHPSEFEGGDRAFELFPQSSESVHISGQIGAASRSPPFRPSVKETQGNGDQWKSTFDPGNLAMPPSSSGDSHASPRAGVVGTPPANLFVTPPTDALGSPPSTSTNCESGLPPPPELFEAPPPPQSNDDFGAQPADLFGCPPVSALDASNSAVQPGSLPPSAWASPPPSSVGGASRFGAFEVPPPPPPPPPDQRECFNSFSGWDLQRANTIASTSRDGEEDARLTEAVRSHGPSVADRFSLSCSPPPSPPPPPPSSSPDLGSPPASAFGAVPLESFGGPPGSAVGFDVSSSSHVDDDGRVSPGSNAGQCAGDKGAFAADREQIPSAPDVFGFPPSGNNALGGAGAGRVPEAESVGEARQGDSRTFAGVYGKLAAVDSRLQSAFRPPPPTAEEPRGVSESPPPAAVGTPSNDVFGGGGSDESAAPWWQTDTGDKEQADIPAADPKSTPHFSNVEKTSDDSAFPADGAGFGEIHQDENKEIPSFAPPISNAERKSDSSRFPADGAGFGEVHQDESAEITSSALVEDPGPPPHEWFGGRTEEWQQKPVVAKPPLPPPPIVGGPSQGSSSRNSNPYSTRSYPADSATSRREAAASAGAKAVASTSLKLSVAGKTLNAQNANVVSPGWEGKPPPHLELGVFGAPRGDAFGAQASNLFGAPGRAGFENADTDGGHSSWDMCFADEAPATKNLTAGKETLIAAPLVPEGFPAPPKRSPRLFASRSESWRASRGSLMDSTPGIGIEDMFAKRTTSGTSLNSQQLGHGSNQAKGVASGDKPLKLTAKSTAEDPSKDEPAHTEQRKWSYPVPSEASGVGSLALFHRASYRNEESAEGTEGLGTVAELGRRVEPESTRSTAFGAWSNGSGVNAAETESCLPGESAALGTPPPLVYGLFPTATEADTTTALDSSFPRPEAVTAAPNEAAETSHAVDSREKYTELGGAPKPRDSGQDAGATPKVPRVLVGSPANERVPRTVEHESPSSGQSGSVLAGQTQVGSGKEAATEAPPAAVKIADEPVIRLSEEVVAEGTVSEPSALPGLSAANSMTEDGDTERQGDIVTAIDDGDGWGEVDWGDEDDDDGTHADAAAGVVAGGGGEGHESSPFQEKNGSAGSAGKHEERNLFSSGDEGGDARSVNSLGVVDGDDGDVSDSEKKEETDRSSDGDDKENDLSTAETTASDFFAPPASSNANPESPRPISRKTSQGSLSSISPLSGDGSGSGSRRANKGGRGVSEGHRRHSVSPFLPVDGPPMFPLSGLNYVRPRRASAGGLPPPVPSAVAATGPAAERAPRATWRSLSPSRLVDDKDRLIFSPLLQDRRGGSRGNSPRGKMASFSAGRLGVNLDYVSPRVASLPYLPPRGGLSKPYATGRVPNDWDRQLSDERVGGTRPSQALGLAYRGNLLDSGQSGRSLPNGNCVKSAGAKGEGAPPLASSSPSGVKSGEFPARGFGQTADLSVGSPPSEATKPLTQPASVGNQANSEQVSGLESESPLEQREGHGFAASPLEMPTGRTSVPSLSRDVDVAPSHSDASPNDPPRNANALELEAATTAEALNAARHMSTPASPNEPAESADMSWATGGATKYENAVDEGHREREDMSANGIAEATTLPALSADVFGTSSGDFGLTTQPSPFVNTSSPLTRRPDGQEPSMFGPDSGEGVHDDDGAGNTGVNGAADLFADNAPAGTADALFTNLAQDEQGGTTGGQSLGETGDDSGNTNDFIDPFSQGPPPQEPPPPSSLPNPWGSSPQKKPLTGPKRWPAKGGTGFDRPLTPTSSAETVTLVESSSGEAGTIPAAFFGPAANSEMTYPAEGGLGGSKVLPRGSDEDERTDANGGNVSHQVLPLPTSFMHSKAPAGKIATRRVTPWANGTGPLSFGASSTPAPARYSSTAGVFRGQSDGQRSAGAWCRSSSAYSAASEDKAPRDPSLKPSGVIAMFGFGGKLVTMHPRRTVRLASSPAVNLPGDDKPANLSRCRNGPVKVWALKDLTEPRSVVHDVDTFPGPAASAPAKKLKEYVEARATGEGETENEASGKRLLWTVASLALKFKGRLTSEKGAGDPASPEAALVQFLKECNARLKDRAASKGSRVVDASLVFPGAATPGVSRVSSKEQFFRPGGAGFPGTVPGTVSGTESPFPGPFPGASRPGGTGVRGGVAAPMPMGVGPFEGAPAGFGVGVGRADDHRSAGGQVEGSEATTGSQEEVEALLVDGKKEEAVDASIRAGLWGLALLIAAQCPTPTTDSKEPGDAPPQPPYQRVVRLYANAFLKSGTPLYTMAMAFSGQAGAAIKHGGKSLMAAGRQDGGGVPSVGVGARGFDGFEETWMATAAAIISNKVAGWADQLIALGDRLLDSGKVPAAHSLFLVAGMQIELPTTKGARLVLPGVDHRKPAHRALRTRESTEAVHILEVLEVAGKDVHEQNSAAQGHKLRLAMRLADLGLLEKAAQYIQSTQEEVAAIGGRSQWGSEQRSPYSPQFITALNEFEDRVCAARGVPGTKPDAGGSAKKERTAGSAAAGAGGWLLNRVTSLVKTSATPGPAPTHQKHTSNASPSNGNGIPPQQTQPRGPQAGSAWGRNLQQHNNAPPFRRPGQPPLPTPFQPPASNERNSEGWREGNGSVSSGFGSPPMPPGVSRATGPTSARMQQGTDEGRVSSGGDLDRAASAPAVPHGMDTNTQGTCGPSGDNGFGMQGGVQEQQGMEGGAFDMNTRPDMDGSPGLERSSMSRAQSPRDHHSPGVGAATVARRLLTRSNGGVPHVSSEPVLSSRSGDGAGEPVKPQGGGGGPQSARGHDVGKSKKGIEQAPKSEPKNKPTGKEEKRRRASASGAAAAAAAAAAVTAKPGRFTKMMAKLFYPDAKHADVGNEMEAYYDNKAQRWVFPGETAEEAAAAAPSAPPTVSQLASPPGSQTGSASLSPSIPGLDANDPLAALMAPPKVSVGGPRRHTSPSGGEGRGPPFSGSRGPPLSGGLRSGESGWAKGGPPSSGGGGGAIGSPFPTGGKFTVFAPKPPAAGSATGGSWSSSASSAEPAAADGGD